MPRTPIEARLATALEREAVSFREQVAIGQFSVDFLILSSDGQPMFAVECDGVEYHDATRDRERDAQIMKQAGLQVLRFRGKQINFGLSSCLRTITETLALKSGTAKSPNQTFDPIQAEIVSAPLGPRLVYAPAGSGKTRVLIGRIVHLIQKFGLRPDRICAMTFTRAGVKEIRTRLAESLSSTLAEQVVVGTFHALAGKLKISEGRQVVDDDRQIALLTAAIRHARLALPTDELQQFISIKKANLVDVANFGRQVSAAEHLEGSSSDSSKKQLLQAWQFYEDELTRAHECDWDDLLLWLVLKARKDNQWAEKLSTLFDYVLVDEAQDNNHAQDEILKVLTSRHSNFTIVGDDDQSIYGFRGAQPSLFRDKEKVPNTQISFLYGNYRSHPAIVLTALGFITGSNERRLKSMRPERFGSGVPIEWIESNGPVDEARAIAARISQLKSEGCQLSDIAILVRSNYHSEVMANELAAAGIPIMNHSHDSILKKRAARVLLSYLHVVRGDRTWQHWSQVLRNPNRYFPSEIWDELQQSEDVLGRWESFASRLAGTGEAWKGERWQNDIDKFRHVLSVADSEPSELILELRRQFSLDDAFDQLIEGKVVFSGKPHLEYIQSMSKSFRTTSELLEYCEALARSSRSSELTTRVDIRTIHGAKGLEYPVVFLAQINKSQFPHPQNDLQEERRLCYVAITRAMEKLVLCWDPQFASSFVAEVRRCVNDPINLLLEKDLQLPQLPYRIGDTVFDPTLHKRLLIVAYSSLHGIYVQGDDKQKQWVSRSATASWRPWQVRTDPGEKIVGTSRRIGDRVRHPALGDGTILEYRSDRGFLVDFFVQKVWLTHESL